MCLQRIQLCRSYPASTLAQHDAPVDDAAALVPRWCLLDSATALPCLLALLVSLRMCYQCRGGQRLLAHGRMHLQHAPSLTVCTCAKGNIGMHFYCNALRSTTVSCHACMNVLPSDYA